MIMWMMHVRRRERAVKSVSTDKRFVVTRRPDRPERRRGEEIGKEAEKEAALVRIR